MVTLMDGKEWDLVSTPSQQLRQNTTSRPTPKFFPQAQTFSTKKERIENIRKSVFPKPPCKNERIISRIFPHRNELSTKAQPISFNDSNSSNFSVSYNSKSKELYFDQCFDIICRLGVGSFGEVFKVKSKEDGELYAIKISKERFRGRTDKKNKLEEVARHEQLPTHKNCLQFIQAWEEGQRLYIQTELCNTSLFEFAERNHNIPIELIESYLLDLILGVKHLHDNGLVHMDIKPENILISDQGVCKLGDLGLVLEVNKKGQIQGEHQEGDPRYLAPELLTGDFGKPADVFSLGVTVLELTGDIDLPRGGDLWHKLRQGTVPEEFNKGLPKDLHDVLQDMMKPIPSQRPTVGQLVELPYLQAIKKRCNSEDLKKLPLVYTPKKSDVPEGRSNWNSSEDDFDEGISLHNHSAGNPLNFSSSSDDYIHDHLGVVQSHQPITRHVSLTNNKMRTTPRLRPHSSRSSARSAKNTLKLRYLPNHRNQDKFSKYVKSVYQRVSPLSASRFSVRSDLFANMSSNSSASSTNSSPGSCFGGSYPMKDETRVKLFTSSPVDDTEPRKPFAPNLKSPGLLHPDSCLNHDNPTPISPKNLMNEFSLEQVL